MISPLIEYIKCGCIHFHRYAVLGNNSKAKRSDKLVYAVVYLRVDVVRSACQNDYFLTLCPCLSDYLLRLSLDIPMVSHLLRISLVKHSKHLLCSDVIL